MLRAIQCVAVSLACIGLVVPAKLAAAAGPGGSAAARPNGRWDAAVRDVTLGPGGRLVGTVINGAGQPLAQQEVVIASRSGGRSQRLVSAADGRFACDQLQAGIVQLTVGETAIACRLWTADAAPPAAADQLVVVLEPTVARGQRPIGELFFSPPLLCTLIIIAAIAIPIAVHNSQDDAS